MSNGGSGGTHPHEPNPVLRRRTVMGLAVHGDAHGQGRTVWSAAHRPVVMRSFSTAPDAVGEPVHGLTRCGPGCSGPGHPASPRSVRLTLQGHPAGRGTQRQAVVLVSVRGQVVRGLVTPWRAWSRAGCSGGARYPPLAGLAPGASGMVPGTRRLNLTPGAYRSILEKSKRPPGRFFRCRSSLRGVQHPGPTCSCPNRVLSSLPACPPCPFPDTAPGSAF
jgi:hypothetical protein